MVTLTINNVRGICMARKVQKIESEKECEVSQSTRKREDEMIDLLKQIVQQNEQVIQLLTNLKDRFV